MLEMMVWIDDGSGLAWRSAEPISGLAGAHAIVFAFCPGRVMWWARGAGEGQAPSEQEAREQAEGVAAGKALGEVLRVLGSALCGECGEVETGGARLPSHPRILEGGR